MPQLDIMSFFTQFFWFSIVFSFFYVFLLHYILPLTVISLKFRKRILKASNGVINEDKKYILGIFAEYDIILQKTLGLFRSYINNVLDFSKAWILSTLLKVNFDSLLVSNSFFLKILVGREFYSTIFIKELEDFLILEFLVTKIQ